jgi:signal transduction histidine kinase
MRSHPSGTKWYAFAVAVVAISAAARAALAPLLGDHFLFVTFYPAVMLATWYGGFGPGLVAAALSMLSACVLNPTRVTDAPEVASLTLFTIASAFIVPLLAGLQGARRRAEAGARRSTFLAEASSVLASSLDYEPTLHTLARLAVPFLADWCSVDVIEEDGSVRRIALVHENPAKAGIARPAAVYPPDPEGRHPRTRVLRTGHPVLIEEVTDEGLERIGLDEEHRRTLRALGYRSAMIVALVARGRILGALSLATAESGRHYTQADLEFAEALARPAALALDNARLYGEAQAASRLKDEFLATVSHELRTPLAAMMAWVAALKRKKLSEEHAARALDILERTGRAQAKLVEDLLEVSRIVTGRMRLDRRPVDLVPVVEAAIAALRPNAEAKGIRVVAALDASVGPVDGDPERLQQVVWNLVSNALKFTPQGGRIEVALERQDGRARIAVSDTGEGIHADFLPHVFDAFRQAHGAGATKRQSGLGLGLTIARRLVELHGGAVEARSEGEGQGATFVVMLPLAAPDVRIVASTRDAG